MVLVKVKVLTTTPKGPLPEVQIQMEEKMPMYMLKAQIEEKTGIPIEFQKVMLAGIGQMCVADARTNIGFSHCGSANSLYFGMIEVPPAPGASAGRNTAT